MHRSVERSLRLPGVDRLQICSLYDHEHIGFTAAMAPGDPVEVLRQLQETGVIQHLGVAGSPIKMTMQHQEAVPFWEICQPHGVAALIAAPYGSGILAKGPGIYSRYMYNQAPETYLHRAFALESLCSRYGVGGDCQDILRLMRRSAKHFSASYQTRRETRLIPDAV